MLMPWPARQSCLSEAQISECACQRSFVPFFFLFRVVLYILISIFIVAQLQPKPNSIPCSNQRDSGSPFDAVFDLWRTSTGRNAPCRGRRPTISMRVSAQSRHTIKPNVFNSRCLWCELPEKISAWECLTLSFMWRQSISLLWDYRRSFQCGCNFEASL